MHKASIHRHKLKHLHVIIFSIKRSVTLSAEGSLEASTGGVPIRSRFFMIVEHSWILIFHRSNPFSVEPSSERFNETRISWCHYNFRAFEYQLVLNGRVCKMWYLRPDVFLHYWIVMTREKKKNGITNESKFCKKGATRSVDALLCLNGRNGAIKISCILYVHPNGYIRSLLVQVTMGRHPDCWTSQSKRTNVRRSTSSLIYWLMACKRVPILLGCLVMQNSSWGQCAVYVCSRFFSRAVKVSGENQTVRVQRLETLVLKLRLAIVRTNSFFFFGY